MPVPRIKKGVPAWLKKIKPWKSSLTPMERIEVKSGIVAARSEPVFDQIRKDLQKQAKSLELTKLIEAKKQSDVGNYRQKNKILGGLLHNVPDQFKVDSILNAKYTGITHTPSGFKIHVPRRLVPPGIEKIYNEQPNRTKGSRSMPARRKRQN